MMRSMFSAVSGLRNHQVRMDVIGNNIANVNTIGFKAGRVTFQDMMYELIKGSGAPMDSFGGTNPQQVGLGMMVRSIDTMMTQGSLESTGKATDIAIQGEGFFILDTGDGNLFSRVGAFDINLKKELVDPATGYHVKGWMADDGGGIDTSVNPEHVIIQLGQLTIAKATANIAFTGNLDADAADDATATADAQVFDSQGKAHYLVTTFTKSADNTWSYVVKQGEDEVGSGTLKFKPDGTYDEEESEVGEITLPASDGADEVKITPNFDGCVHFASDKSKVTTQYQDGFPMGTLENFSISADGIITGTFTNGMNKKLARLALGMFANPAGLLKAGASMFKQSNNSGELSYGLPGSDAYGTLVSGALEMANVDLSREFTNMIVTQRGFQANSRVISTTDDMLQELVNLKR